MEIIPNTNPHLSIVFPQQNALKFPVIAWKENYEEGWEPLTFVSRLYKGEILLVCDDRTGRIWDKNGVSWENLEAWQSRRNNCHW